MRASPNGWHARDVRAVYRQHGFEEDEGGDHTLFIHPLYPDLRAMVTRASGAIATGYAHTAVKLIDELERRENER